MHLVYLYCGTIDTRETRVKETNTRNKKELDTAGSFTVVNIATRFRENKVGESCRRMHPAAFFFAPIFTNKRYFMIALNTSAAFDCIIFERSLCPYPQEPSFRREALRYRGCNLQEQIVSICVSVRP